MMHDPDLHLAAKFTMGANDLRSRRAILRDALDGMAGNPSILLDDLAAWSVQTNGPDKAGTFADAHVRAVQMRVRRPVPAELIDAPVYPEEDTLDHVGSWFLIAAALILGILAACIAFFPAQTLAALVEVTK